MNKQSIFRILLVVILLVGLSISCNFISDVKETFELKNSVEAIITEFDIEALSTEFDIESMATEFDFEAIETEIESMATEFDFEAIVTEFEGGELLGTPEFQIPEVVGERPADIPIMPNAGEITESSDFVEYFIEVDISQVISFYELEMPKNGWGKTREEKADEYATIVYTKGGRTATVDLNFFFGETSVSIAIEGN